MTIDQGQDRRGKDRLQRVPPHDLGTEMALLGAAMHNREAVVLVAGMDPAVFYGVPNRLIASAIGQLHNDGVPVDTGTVAARLSEDGQLDDVSGVIDGVTRIGTAYLVGLLAHGPYLGTPRAQLDVDRIESLARKRRILTLAYSVSEGVYARTDIGGLAAELVGTIEADAAGALSTWEPVNLAAVLAGEGEVSEPEILHRTDGAALLYPGKVHAFNAEPESGKSWLSLRAALEVVESGGHVLLVDFEDSAATMVERLLSLGADPGQLLDRVHYVRPDEPVDTGATARVKSILATWPIRLAVVDGIGEAMAMSSLDEDKGPDVVTFLTRLVRPMARAGVAVLLLDHVVKDRDKRGGYASGSHKKKGGVDVTIELAVVKPFGRGRDGLVKVVVTKDRPGWVRGSARDGKVWADLVIRSADEGSSVTLELRPPEGWPATENGVGFRPTELMARVSRWLAVNGPASVEMIRTAVPGRAEWVGKAVRCLVDEGYAVRSRVGIEHARLFDPTIRDDEPGVDASSDEF